MRANWFERQHKKYTPLKIQGFSLVELLIVLSLMSIIGLAITPLLQRTAQRNKEQQLSVALKQIRQGLDDFKYAWDHNEIPKSLSLTGYPTDINVLVEGVILTSGQRRRFLKVMPRDPFLEESSNSASPQSIETAWQWIGYQTGKSPPQSQEGIWDVHSTSIRIGLNGVPYTQW